MGAVPGALSLHAALISFFPGVGEPLKSLPSCPSVLFYQRAKEEGISTTPGSLSSLVLSQ